MSSKNFLHKFHFRSTSPYSQSVIVITVFSSNPVPDTYILWSWLFSEFWLFPFFCKDALCSLLHLTLITSKITSKLTKSLRPGLSPKEVKSRKSKALKLLETKQIIRASPITWMGTHFHPIISLEGLHSNYAEKVLLVQYLLIDVYLPSVNAQVVFFLPQSVL